MKKITIHLLTVVLFFSFSFHSCGQQIASSSLKVIPVEEYAKQIIVDSIQLVDVRTPEEYHTGHIKSFINIDWQGENFEAEISKLDKSKPTYIHCRSGKRSAAAGQVMQKLGFTKVFDLKGGINAWKEEGKPVE